MKNERARLKQLKAGDEDGGPREQKVFLIYPPPAPETCLVYALSGGAASDGMTPRQYLVFVNDHEFDPWVLD